MTQRVSPEPTSQERAGPPPPFPPTIRDGQRLRMVVVNDRANSTASAVAALAELGIATRRAELLDRVDPSDTDLAVVVAGAESSPARMKEAIGRLRDGKVAVLVLAAHEDDDVVLQDCTTARNGGTLVSLELARRIRARLRNVPLGLLRFGSLTIDVRRREAALDGAVVDLRRREFDLLVCLASVPGRAFSRRELLEAVWHSSGDWQTVSTVTEHIRRLRGKLQPQPGMRAWIVTVRSVGYRFNPYDASES